jgi:hypothetical protein
LRILLVVLQSFAYQTHVRHRNRYADRPDIPNQDLNTKKLFNLSSILIFISKLLKEIIINNIELSLYYILIITFNTI